MAEETKESGLYHSFFLLESETYQPGRNSDRAIDLDAIFRDHNCVNIHDDHLRYLNDTLLWIPTSGYWKKEESKGLNLHGNTIIKKNGADIAHRILTNWADLFRCGTEVFELTGDYSFDETNPGQGFYEKIPTNRNEFVKKLETLVGYCEEVIETDDRNFIWHFGI